MLIVRNTFTAKPGQAGNLVQHLKEMAEVGQMRNPRIMTDVVGPFNHVVFEHEVESLAAFEESFARYAKDPKIREKAKGYLEFWSTGKREIFRLA